MKAAGQHRHLPLRRAPPTASSSLSTPLHMVRSLRLSPSALDSPAQMQPAVGLWTWDKLFQITPQTERCLDVFHDLLHTPCLGQVPNRTAVAVPHPFNYLRLRSACTASKHRARGWTDSLPSAKSSPCSRSADTPWAEETINKQLSKQITCQALTGVAGPGGKGTELRRAAIFCRTTRQASLVQ